MQVGINAGFGDSLAAEFAGLASYGFAVSRQDLYVYDDPTRVPALVTEFVQAPVTPLFLIGGGQMVHADGTSITPAQLAAWTSETVDLAHAAGLTHYLVEIGNEPDIVHADYSNHPRHFSDAVQSCYDAARTHGFTGTIISGGIANLNDRGLTYLDGAGIRMWPQDLVVGFHRYPAIGRGPLAAHDRFRSREEEWQALLSLVGGRSVACTEFGYHTAPEPPWSPRSDEEVAASVLWDLTFYEERAVRLACVYQLNDGPTETWIDRFGVRRLDGTWKLVAECIRETVRTGLSSVLVLRLGYQASEQAPSYPTSDVSATKIR